MRRRIGHTCEHTNLGSKIIEIYIVGKGGDVDLQRRLIEVTLLDYVWPLSDGIGHDSDVIPVYPRGDLQFVCVQSRGDCPGREPRGSDWSCDVFARLQWWL